MSISNINNFCGVPNLAGLVKVEYAPVHWIFEPEFERVITDAGNWQYTITFTTGTWLTASVLPSGRLWTESPQNAQQGTFYRQEVRAIAPKLRPEVSAVMQRMEKMGFLLKLQDKNGNPWILGDLDHPFFFNAAASTGDDTGLNSYELSWVSETKYRASGFVPQLP